MKIQNKRNEGMKTKCVLPVHKDELNKVKNAFWLKRRNVGTNKGVHRGSRKDTN